MNTERLEVLAATIEDVPHATAHGTGASEHAGFNLDGWTHGGDCGSPRCLGGWTVWLFHHDPDRVSDCDVLSTATALLGLTGWQGRMLFCPGGLDRSAVTPQFAARVVREFVRDGVVNWGPRWSRWMGELAEETACGANA